MDGTIQTDTPHIDLDPIFLWGRTRVIGGITQTLNESTPPKQTRQEVVKTAHKTQQEMLEIDRLRTFSQNSTIFRIVNFCGFLRFDTLNSKKPDDFCLFMLTFDDFMLTLVFLTSLFSIIYLYLC